MTGPLPRPVRLLIARLPADWAESIEGDLQEERARRLAQGRAATGIWLTTLAIQIVAQIAIERARAPRAGFPRSRRMRGMTEDLRQAARRLVRQPAYALLAVMTLAIGIGATTSVFTLANWVLFRPVPGVVDGDRLVTVGFGTPDGSRGPYPFVDLLQLRAQVAALSALAGSTGAELHGGRSGTTPERISGQLVSGNYFAVLGGAIARGRGFGPDADRPDGTAEVIISDRLAQRWFAADPAVIGAEVTINARPFTIVGVAAPGFQGASRSGATDAWLPLGCYRTALPMYPAGALTTRQPPLLFEMVGRLASGATLRDVEAQSDAVRAALAAAFPNDRRLATWRFIVHPGLEARPWVREQMARTMALLAGFATLLLALTCANATNLMLGRAAEVRGEMATRLALGASRWRLGRLLLVESALLSSTAAALAVAATAALARLLEGTTLMQGVAPLDRARIDWRVLAFAVAVTSVAVLMAGLLPAVRGSRVPLRTAIGGGGRTHTVDRRRTQRALTVAQVAVSVALLVAAALLTRSMLARLALSPGYDATRVLSFSIDPALQGITEERQQQVYREVLERVGEIPGTAGAGLAWLPLFGQGAAGREFTVAGGSDEPISADANMISPGFFAALGLPFVEGRDFRPAEFLARRESDGVAIITESLARRAFGDGPAAGRRISMLYPAGREWTVVGVVRDTRVRRLAAESPGVLFEPFNQTFHAGSASVVVGLSAPAGDVIPRLRDAVARVDPTLPIFQVATLDRVIRLQFSNDLLVMRLTLACAALATLLAAVGLYGVLTRSLAARRRELGIRAALGATPAGVAGQVVRESGLVFAVGLLVGAPLAVGLTRVVSSRLFDVAPADPLSLAAAVVTVAVVIAAATVLPARRAARIDPVEVLR